MSEVIKKINEMSESVFQQLRESDNRYDELKSRIEQVEARSDLPRRAANDSNYGTADEREHKSKFLDWVRKPFDGQTKRILDEAQAEMEKKNIVIGTDSSGGYAVPELIYNEIEERVATMNPFRSLVNVGQAGSSDFKLLVSKNQAGTGWATEGV